MRAFIWIWPVCHLILPFMNYDWLERERTKEEKSEEAEREPCSNDSYFLPSQETPLLKPDFLELQWDCLFIPLIIHSFLKRDQVRKKGAVGRNGGFKAHLLNPKASPHFFVLKHSLYGGVSKLYLFIHSFSFCVYCRAHSLA